MRTPRAETNICAVPYGTHGVTHMRENLINGAARPDSLRSLDKAKIAKTWQQYYEDRGYELWGFSPSPTARILAQAILDSKPRKSERIEIVDWGCGYGRDSLTFLDSVLTSSELT